MIYFSSRLYLIVSFLQNWKILPYCREMGPQEWPVFVFLFLLKLEKFAKKKFEYQSVLGFNAHVGSKCPIFLVLVSYFMMIYKEDLQSDLQNLQILPKFEPFKVKFYPDSQNLLKICVKNDCKIQKIKVFKIHVLDITKIL